MTNTAITLQEVQQFRKDTPGTIQKIHFNNAGSALPPDVVVDTVIDYLNDEAMIGGYEAEYQYRDQLENAYTLIARLINASKDEIAIVENASTAWALAFNGITFNPGDEIITSEMEYVTNIIGFINAQKNHGVITRVIPNDAQGNFDLNALENTVSSKTKLIAITHIPSTAGGMMPIVEIGRVANKHGILYLVDACQSAGQIPLDVVQIGCDMLSVTGRKYLRAPRGTGFLFIKKDIQDKIKQFFIDGFSTQWVSQSDFKPRDDARRFELYENNRALTLGLGKAVEYALQIGVDRSWQRIQHLSGLLRKQLQVIEGITVHDIGQQQCGIVTFTVNRMASDAVKNQLAARHINTSVGQAKSTLYYMEKNNLTAVVRASIHYYNTEEEINTMCNVLKSL